MQALAQQVPMPEAPTQQTPGGNGGTPRSRGLAKLEQARAEDPFEVRNGFICLREDQPRRLRPRSESCTSSIYPGQLEIMPVRVLLQNLPSRSNVHKEENECF